MKILKSFIKNRINTDIVKIPMKLNKIIIAIIAASVSTAYAQETKKPDMIYIVEGLFFKEIPIDHSLLNGSMSIQTANGTKASGMILKEPLPEDARKFAIPMDEIPEADILLEMFNEKQRSIIRFSVSKEELLKVGDRFPSFIAKDIDGKEWKNADTDGKVMVLNCWFTGCGPCRAEMPELSQWKNEMPDVMFFSSTYERPKTALPVLEKSGFNWIHLVNDTQFKTYIGNNGYPMTIVVDKNGVIAQIEYGTSPLKREKLKNTIQSLR